MHAVSASAALRPIPRNVKLLRPRTTPASEKTRKPSGIRHSLSLCRCQRYCITARGRLPPVGNRY